MRIGPPIISRNVQIFLDVQNLETRLTSTNVIEISDYKCWVRLKEQLNELKKDNCFWDDVLKRINELQKIVGFKMQKYVLVENESEVVLFPRGSLGLELERLETLMITEGMKN